MSSFTKERDHLGKVLDPHGSISDYEPDFYFKAIHFLLTKFTLFYSSEDLVQPKMHTIPSPCVDSYPSMSR